MKVTLTATARQDLRDIGDFIAQDSRARARSFVLELRDACLSLADRPYRFARLEGLEGQDYRRRVYGNYLILYRVTSDVVTIMRVVSAAMDTQQLRLDS